MSQGALDQRTKIVRAAADLLVRGGRDAVSTRAVSAAAGVQAPALYRQFGDMHELLHAAALEVFAGYMRDKTKRKPHADPIEELKHGWDLHVEFGLANPAAYTLLYADTPSEALAADLRKGYAMLEAHVTRAAEAGRLKVSVPHAARLMHASGRGVVLSLISSRPEDRDPKLAGSMRDAVFAAITSAPISKKETQGPARVAARAVALRAVLADASDVLSAAERDLMSEWLDRLTARRS